jgi:enamine deaminase RidA (YjgF/YER057c/UK114 family)
LQSVRRDNLEVVRAGQRTTRLKERTVKREVIRVEPLSTYLEKWKAPTSAVTRHGDTIYVSGFPPFDPATGEVLERGLLSRRKSFCNR